MNDGIRQSHRLTLISAPAGYGKSTLLSEWVSQAQLPVAWLSLESGENSPTRFWEYFITALETIPIIQKLNIGETSFQALNSLKPPSMEELLSRLLNEFSLLKGPVVLVLDDLHLITDHQVHKDLIFLIDHLPSSSAGLHLVVASRMDPPWPLARWRVREQLTELRPADLRFSYDETALLLNQVLNLGLSAHDIAALQDRTEGWVAGLQLAAISIQGRIKSQGAESASHFIETFTGSNKFILDYLMDEVISQQPVHVRDFLYGTSILEHLSVPLCDALLARNDSREVLNLLDQANLFLIPLDDERRWYRYHHLMSELLRKHLNQTSPEKAIELHQRACDWFAERNYLSEAIMHALDAGDIPVVNELVSGNALAMVERAELLDVLGHFETMPTKIIASKPWLAVAYAWVKAYADPSGGVDAILQQAEAALPTVQDQLTRQHLTCQLAAIRAYVSWVIGEPDQSLVWSAQAMQGLPAEDFSTRAHLLNTMGLAYQYKYDLVNAGRCFESAIAAGHRSGKPHSEYFAYANLAYTSLARGRLNEALALCKKVINIAGQDNQGSLRMPVLAYAYSTLCLVQLERNELEAALSSARQSVFLAGQWNQADTLHFTLTSLSRVWCAFGNFEEAFSVNRRAMQLAVNVSTWFIKISLMDEVQFNLIEGDISTAAERYEALQPLLSERDTHGSYAIINAALANAQGRFSDTTMLMEDLIPKLEQADVGWVVMSLQTLQALALHGLGREEEAFSLLKHCLEFARQEGFVRTFVDRGLPMAELLQLASQRGIEVDYIAGLLDCFKPYPMQQAERRPRTGDNQPPAQVVSLIEPLSQRELQVLRLLDSPLTNEEIGRQLFVSVNTIRTHVRNIFSKLGVNRRVEAIIRAKELKLI